MQSRQGRPEPLNLCLSSLPWLIQCLLIDEIDKTIERLISERAEQAIAVAQVKKSDTTNF